MLNAIIHGKAGRMSWSEQNESYSWRQVFQTREDLLTATFFERFTYLSELLQHKLLKHWLGVGDFTEFEGIDYWPKYDLPEQETREFVEPDVLLQYASANVLVEVKPPEGGDQYLDQWLLELEGYFAQNSSSTPLYFLAIGRVGNVLTQFISQAESHQMTLLKGINTLEWQPIASDLERRLDSGKLDAQDQRIVLDMLNTLELYGVRAHNLTWDDLLPLAEKLSSLDCSEAILTKMDDQHG